MVRGPGVPEMELGIVGDLTGRCDLPTCIHVNTYELVPVAGIDPLLVILSTINHTHSDNHVDKTAIDVVFDVLAAVADADPVDELEVHVDISRGNHVLHEVGRRDHHLLPRHHGTKQVHFLDDFFRGKLIT